MRRAVGISSYHNSVRPVVASARTRKYEEQEPRIQQSPKTPCPPNIDLVFDCESHPSHRTCDQCWDAYQYQQGVKEEVELRALEMAMTGIGLLSGTVAIGCALALVAYWISPWAIVAIAALAGIIYLAICDKKRGR